MNVNVDRYVIHLEGVRFRGKHGASRAERDLPQDFVASLDIELPVSALAKTDSVKHVVDYGTFANLVVQVGTESSYQLLETLAQTMIARIFAESKAERCRVAVKKFGPPTEVSVDSASIEVSASRIP